MKSFIGVTGHMIVDFKLHTVLLACARVKGRHTAENILHYYEKVVSDYDLSGKIVAVVTDNAANMVKAFTLPGYQDDIEMGEEDDNEAGEDVTDDVLEDIPQHDRCFAHTLQLIVKDGLQSDSQINSILSKVSTIVGHVRKSTIATELLENECRVQAACPTRWNSQLAMVRSVVDIPANKLNEACPTKLSGKEREQLDEFIKIMSLVGKFLNLYKHKLISTFSIHKPPTA